MYADIGIVIVMIAFGLSIFVILAILAKIFGKKEEKWRDDGCGKF